MLLLRTLVERQIVTNSTYTQKSPSILSLSGLKQNEKAFLTKPTFLTKPRANPSPFRKSSAPQTVAWNCVLTCSQTPSFNIPSHTECKKYSIQPQLDILFPQLFHVVTPGENKLRHKQSGRVTKRMLQLCTQGCGHFLHLSALIETLQKYSRKAGKSC